MFVFVVVVVVAVVVAVVVVHICAYASHEMSSSSWFRWRGFYVSMNCMPVLS